MKRTAILILACSCLASCQSSTQRTTTTRMGITGAQETVLTEVPWESEWDQAFAEALRGTME